MANFALALSLIFILAPTYARASAPVLPKMNEIVEAQFSCDWKSIKKYPWSESSRDYIRLANKVWEVVKDVKIEARSPTLFPQKNEIEEGYTLTLTAMATLRCGEDTVLLNQGKGEFYKTLPVLFTVKNQNFFDYSDDTTPPREVGNRLTVSDGATDAPALRERTGFMCLVKYEDFMRDEKSIDLKKLCHKESRAKITKTKKEIERVRALLKKANS